MARYKRLPTVANRRPDEFVSAIDHLLKWTAHYKVHVLAVVGVILVSSLVIFISRLNREKGLLELNRALFETSIEDGAGAYAELIGRSRGQYPAELARLDLIQNYIVEGQVEPALKEIEIFVKEGPRDMIPVITLGKVVLLWDTGRLEEALSTLDEFKQGKFPIVGRYPDYLKAQILESAGRLDEALLTYQSLASGGEDDRFVRDKAQGRLVWLKLNRAQSE